MADATALNIVFVAAVARNRVIGRAGELPWRLPGDLRRSVIAQWADHS